MFKQLAFAAASLSLLQLACSRAPGSDLGDERSGGSGPAVGVPGSGGKGSGGTAGGGGGGSGGASGSGGATGSGGAATGSGGAGPAADPDAGSADAGAVAVPASGEELLVLISAANPATFKTEMAPGEVYLLRANGTMKFGDQKVDAEYGFGAGAPVDEVGGVDVGIDIGRLQIHPKVHTTATPPGPGRMKWGAAGGAFREDHTYYMLITAGPQPERLSVKMTAPPGGVAGTDAMMILSLRPLSPAPPRSLGTELETIMVPLLKTQVTTKLTTVAGKQYILQASGTGKVSKGGIGDAEYMDFDVEGTKFNEGESGADFGIGVDELDVGIKPTGGASYKARLRWWGPWRKDHTYYMIFTGTGKPLDLLYFDSGYGDNGLTDALPLKIFAAP